MPGKVLISDIQRIVCEYEGLSVDQLCGASRDRDIAWPRQAAMWLAWELTGKSYAVIGRAFGGRCLATVYVSRKKVDRAALRNPRLAGLLQEYQRRVALL